MRLQNLCLFVLLLLIAGVCVAGTSVVPTTTLAAQTANNTSAANSFVSQTNGNAGAGSVSKVDVHSLLYAGADAKVFAHLMLWFGGSNHMNVGYNSNDAGQVQRQITDMISRGINGVVIDWYGPNNSIDDATKLVMAESEKHPGFTFAIMIDQGAIEWYSCSGCSPQQALINDLQYLEQTYFTSPAYLRDQGSPVVTNFNIDLSYSVDWNAANSQLSTKPDYVFQNNNGFTHVLSGGSYSWVMPTTSDYGMSYLSSFYNAGLPFTNENTVGATYKGFNDSLASWGSNRVMGQQCGQTWLQTFSEINSLYNSGKQLPYVQLVTWNDYEEGTEIESGINGCLSLTASVSGSTLKWSITGNENTVDHYIPYISIDGQNLMPLGESAIGNSSVNLCSYSIPDGNYTGYVQAVGKPSIVNQISKAVKISLNCGNPSTNSSVTVAASPSSLSLAAGTSGSLTITVAPQSGSFNSAVALSCSGLPADLDCSFAPSSVTPGSQAVTSVLTVVAARSVVSNQSKGAQLLIATFLPGLGLFGFVAIGKINRRSVSAIAVVVMLAGIAVINSSCGGRPVSAVNAASSVPSSYSVLVKGVAGTVQASTTVTVTVN